jgi:phospholipase/carboxylesterase
MKHVELGALKAHLTGGLDRSGSGAGPVLVLMHGYGAPGSDLVPLWRQLRVPRELRFVFPEAPISLDPSDSSSYAPRAWWHIDIARLQLALQTGRAQELVNETPAGMAEARERVHSMLDAIERDLGVPRERLVLGGFSQGAMLAADTVLQSERSFAGLVILSGALVSASSWRPRMALRSGMRVLQSHGRADPILPFAVAEMLQNELGQAGLRVTWLPFNGGHAIPDAVLEALGQFTYETLGKTP